MPVLDASAALEIVLRTPLGERALSCLREFRSSIHAPHLLDVEFTQVLRRLARMGRIGGAEGPQLLADLRSLPIARHSHEPLLPRIWELRDSLSAYDAAYIALAEALEAPLVTCDRKLSRSHGHSAEIELVS